MNQLKIKVGAIASTLFLALILIGGLSTAVKVDAGEACVSKRWGTVQSVETSGLHLRLPLADKYECYSTRAVVYETVDHPESNSKADYVDFAVDGVSVDGQPIQVTYTVRFHIPKENIRSVHQNVGRNMDQVTERVVKFHSRVVVRQVVNSHSAEELYLGGLDTVSQEAFGVLAPLFAESGIILDHFEVKRPTFSAEYTDAIEKKQLAVEEAERKKNETVVAQQEAERKKAEAKGDAEARLIQAEAEAEAMRKEGAVLDEYPEIVDLRAVDAITNADYIIVPGDSIPFLDVPTAPDPQPKD